MIVVGLVSISNSSLISHSMAALVCVLGLSVSCYVMVSDGAWLAPHRFFALQLPTPGFGIRVSAI